MLTKYFNFSLRKSYDHITDRELRKKLKNRESAQAARDRKKAKMMALERQLGDMAERNKFLENENRDLKGRLQRVEAEAFWRLVKQPGEGRNNKKYRRIGLLDSKF